VDGQVSNDGYRFIVTGDSISKGIVFDEEKGRYSILEDNYVNLLRQRLKGMVCNAAKFGNTVIKGLGRLQNEVLRINPDVVLIEYGGNDCDFDWEEIARNPESHHVPKTDFNVFRTMLTETINSLKEKGIAPVLLTLPPLDADRYFKWICKNNPLAGSNILKWLGSVTKIYWWQERYSSAIMQIAQETRTIWIDIRAAFLQQPDFRRFFCLDGIHPNREGHRLIAEKIIEFVRNNYSYLLKDGAVPEPG